MNEMTVTTMVTSEGYEAEVSGAGYNNRGKVHLVKEGTKNSFSNMLEVGAKVIKLLEIFLLMTN
jgi:P-type Ca2+ transporter type 2C